jgi:predicted nucleic acid-binding protein
MIVVCNSTPLIHLSAMKQLELLRELFSGIYVPEEVVREVVTRGVGKPGEIEVRKAKWIKRRRVTNKPALQTLETTLGAGEAACIVLAMTIHADLVVLDDRIARLHAEAHGLRITGTVGILLMAAEKKRLDFEQLLADLLVTGFRLSPQEYNRILNLWRERKGL